MFENWLPWVHLLEALLFVGAWGLEVWSWRVPDLETKAKYLRNENICLWVFAFLVIIFDLRMYAA